MVLQGLVVVKLRLDAKASDNGPIVTVFFFKTLLHLRGGRNVGRKLLLNCNHSIRRVVTTLGSNLT